MAESDEAHAVATVRFSPWRPAFWAMNDAAVFGRKRRIQSASSPSSVDAPFGNGRKFSADVQIGPRPDEEPRPVSAPAAIPEERTASSAAARTNCAPRLR